MKRTSRWRVVSGVAGLWISLTGACGRTSSEESPIDDSATGNARADGGLPGSDGGSPGADGGSRGSDGGLVGSIDCSACSASQVCWFTTDFDGTVYRSGCLELPAECPAPANCDCLNTAEELVCDQVGWVQNSNACQLSDGVPVVECISTLG